MTYYSYNMSINAQGQTSTTNKYGDKSAMEYQYYLFCANSAQNVAGDLLDVVEWGTLEGGKLDRKVWDHRQNAGA